MADRFADLSGVSRAVEFERAERTALPTAAARQGTVFVELGEAAQKAQIARDGVTVPSVKIDPQRLGDIIAGKPEVVAKVVSQSVPPGTTVPKGTAIDIVLAEPRGLPIGIVADFHRGLEQRTVGQVFDTFVRDNVALRSVIARNETPDTLSAADQAVITKAFSDASVPITNQPGQTLAAAFQTVQAAYTFGLD
jgi:hypothetical protein